MSHSGDVCLHLRQRYRLETTLPTLAGRAFSSPSGQGVGSRINTNHAWLELQSALAFDMKVWDQHRAWSAAM